VARREIALPEKVAHAAGPIPSVVIVGRPNVGKSSLLNCLARKRIAIVDAVAGVTRDRISALVQHNDRTFDLWDTGGIGTPDDLAAEVERQIEAALTRADLVLFVVDAREGLIPLDRDIAARLRKIGRPILLVANKVEHAKHQFEAAEFHKLGFGDPIPVSALRSLGRTDLLDRIADSLPEAAAPPEVSELKIAVVGRQNVGKSTLVNRLVGEERVIVSDIPGTTRDAVDVRFERIGKHFVAVDTAGIKKRSRHSDDALDFYSLVRAERAIRRCDVILLMVDITADISRVDKQLATTVEEEAKPCIILVNKWDLAKRRFTTDEYAEYLAAHLTGLSFAPISFISAKTGINLDDTLRLAGALHAQACTQVLTSQINEVLRRAEEQRAPRPRHSKRPRLFYATQAGVAPPKILVFASHPQLISDQYTRYLAGFFRRHLPYGEIPLKIIYRARTRRPQ
jgi:GTP-binding protein